MSGNPATTEHSQGKYSTTEVPLYALAVKDEYTHTVTFAMIKCFMNTLTLAMGDAYNVHNYS